MYLFKVGVAYSSRLISANHYNTIARVTKRKPIIYRVYLNMFDQLFDQVLHNLHRASTPLKPLEALSARCTLAQVRPKLVLTHIRSAFFTLQLSENNRQIYAMGFNHTQLPYCTVFL